MKKFLIALIILFIPFKAFAFGIQNYDVTANILPNGDVEVTETFNLNGTYNGYERKINYINPNLNPFDGSLESFKGSQIYNPKDIELLEIGTTENHNFELNESAESGDYGYYLVNKSIYGYNYRIYNPDRYGETFYIKYLLKDAVVVHNDVAELYYQIFSDELTESVYSYKFELLLNGNKTLKKWAHGPLYGNIHSYKDGNIDDTMTDNVVITIDELDAYEPIDIRVLFDKELVPESTKKSGFDGLESVLKVEEDRANEANLKREEIINETRACVLNLNEHEYTKLSDIRRDYYNCKDRISYIEDEEIRKELLEQLKPVEDKIAKLEFKESIKWISKVVVWLIIMAITIVYAYTKHDKEYRSTFTTRYYRDFPKEYGPEIVSYLMTKKIKDSSVSASLLNLITKKVIKYEQTEKKHDYKLTYIPNSDHVLTPAEEQLIHWFFVKLGKGNSITLSEIKSMAKRKYNVFTTQFNKWKNLVQEEAESYNFFENKMIIKSLVLAVGIVGASFMFQDVSFFNKAATFMLFILLIVCVGTIIYAFCIAKRSKEGNEDYNKWLGLKNFLTDFGSFSSRDLPHIELWEKYIVYAMVFGCAKTLSKTMQIKIREMEVDSTNISDSTIIFHTSSITRLSDEINQTIKDAVHTASYETSAASSARVGSSSSSSGFGGGFSSGGGFGGGGGGGGRF